MKIQSLRKSAGATLGLMAAVILVLFAIGAFLFYTGTLIGGTHELNRASDAGILSVAKQALVQPAVALNDPQLPVGLPYGDFNIGIADQQIGGVPAIDLLTYNQCAAQAVLVGLNAESLGLQSARQHAQAVALAVAGIGKLLQQRFAAGALNGYYDTASSQNTLDMLGGGSTVNRVGNLQQAYVSAGRASNVFFYPDVVDPITVINMHQPSTIMNQIPQNSAPADPKPDQTLAQQNSFYFQPGEQVYYASGYAPITVMPGTAEASLIAFIPNNPQATPHAVDQQRFDSNTATPGGNLLSFVPPNAFQAHAQAEVNLVGNNVAQKNTNLTNAISCAMIGCGDSLGLSGLAALGIPGSAGGPKDTPARIPGGFVRIRNMPGMEQVSASSLPLGPTLAYGSSVDASNFVLNNDALGDGNLSVYIATVNNAVGTNYNNIIFVSGTTNLPALKAWIKFNDSKNFLSAKSPYYDSDVVNGQHRDPSLDPLGSGQTALALAADPTVSPLRMGPNVGQLADLKNAVNVTGYIWVDSLQINGTTNFPIYNAAGSKTGKEIKALQAVDALAYAAGANLGQPAPGMVTVSDPGGATKHRTISWIEYVKAAVIIGFKTHFDQGHYWLSQNNVPNASIAQNSLLSGMKQFDFWLPNGTTRTYISSPNTRYNGAEIPSTTQFMTVGTAAALLSQIDQQITKKGGYQPDQVTYDNFYGAINNQVRMINPKWGLPDLQNALSSMDCAPGDLLYLRDDGSGKLILTNTCFQDTGIQPEASLNGTGANQSTGTNQIVDFATQSGQYIQLDGYVINTLKEASQATAASADANTEQQPWRSQTGTPIYLEQGAILYKSSGYNNLLGEVDLYSRPAQAIAINYTNPN